MPRKLIFSDREESFLRELVKNKVPFLVVGLSAATLQGAPVVTQDIDLWFKNLNHPGIRRALKKLGGAYVPCIGLNPPQFAGNGLDLFDIVLTVDGLDGFDKEMKKSLRIPVGRLIVRVLPLERIIRSKKAAGRQKDKLVLPVLEDALKTIRQSGR